MQTAKLQSVKVAAIEMELEGNGHHDRTGEVGYPHITRRLGFLVLLHSINTRGTPFLFREFIAKTSKESLRAGKQHFISSIICLEVSSLSQSNSLLYPSHPPLILCY
jgi:hypothetical protein